MNFKRRLRHILKDALKILLPYPASWYSHFMGRTTRLTTIALPGYRTLKELCSRPRIFCCWHARFFYFSFYGRGADIYTMISGSRDGEIITRIIRKMRLPAVRGSSTRGNKEAVAEMVALLSRGHKVLMIPDGPRGPRYCFKAGAIRIAQLSGAPLVPVGFSSTRGIFLPTWDHFFLPLPFGRAAFVIGEPIPVPKDITSEEFEQIRLKAEQKMEQLRKKADEMCGRDPDREIEQRKKRKESTTPALGSLTSGVHD